MSSGVLKDLGLTTGEAASNILEVWNKIDLLDPEAREAAIHKAYRADPPAMPVSAVTADGLDRLLVIIDSRLKTAHESVTVELSPALGGLIHWLHEHTEVTGQEATGEGDLRLSVNIDTGTLARLKAKLAEAGTGQARLV